MDSRRSVLLWIEASLTVLTAVACVLTLLVPTWIEVLFDADPDGGDGGAERWLTVALLVVSLAFAGLTRRTWVRLRAAT